MRVSVLAASAATTNDSARRCAHENGAIAMEPCRNARAEIIAHRHSSPLRQQAVGMRFQIALILLLAWLRPASAYVDPPFVTIPPAVEGQEFTVDVRWGRCDALQVFGPMDRELVRNGDTITITVRYLFATGAACIFPDALSRIRVGPLPVGQYRIDLRLRLLEVPTIVYPGPSATIVVQPTQGGVAAPIPGLSLGGLAFLSSLICCLGVYWLRKRRPHPSSFRVGPA